MDTNIDALYNILKQNQGGVNDAVGIKKKEVVASDLLALVAKKTKVSNNKEKVVVDSDSEESDDEDISDLKKIRTLLAKAFNRKKFYAKPTNNNLRTSLASTSANRKPKYKANVKDYNYYKTKLLLAKKDGDSQVLLVEDQALMESSGDSDQELSVNMVSYYSFDSESDSDCDETLDYYDKSETNYGLFIDNEDGQEIFYDAIELASENFDGNLVVSQNDHDELEVDHNESEDKDHLVNKLIVKFT
ncbi:hypothetical protein Tco_0569451 [Tanacetum coccineum]